MGADDFRNPPPTMFDEEDDATVMVPTFGPGSFFADRYRVDALLGSGAMGRVYAATELHSDRRVALKILHKERLGEEETVARFRREAEVLASIGHPCIVEVYTFHHDADGTPYLAMELLEGVTLKTRLTNAGRFEDVRDFQQVLDAICGALSAAHARGVVHRDMKPDNVFLPATGEPRAKLVDFGLSRIAAMANKGLTKSGMILGTPRYMAPEQIRNAASAGPSVDIFSVGVILFESLAGHSPYPAQDYGQLLGCVLEGRVTPLERSRPDLPPALGEVVRRAMDHDIAKRFASCDELADAYASAIGSPSRRNQLAARSAPARPARRIVSNQNLVQSKGSTLAFDVSALDRLPDLSEAAPLFSQGQGSIADERSYASRADAAPMLPPAPPYDRQPPSTPPPPMELPAKGSTLFMPSLSDRPPGAFAQAGMHVGPPSAQRSEPPPAMMSQHGSVMSHAQLSRGSVRPGPHGHQPAQQSFSTAKAQAPQPKKGRGLLLFFIAMIVVIIVSAAGGLALRAYMRGELQVPTLGERSS